MSIDDRLIYRSASISGIGAWGVRGRLLMAFIAVSMFSLAAAATGIYALTKTGQSLDRITERRVPEALAWQKVSRNIERVVTGAPELLAADSEDRLDAASSKVFAQLGNITGLLNEARLYSDLDEDPFFRQGAVDLGTAADSASALLGRISDNFRAINQFVTDRLHRVKLKNITLRKLAKINSVAQRTLLPGDRILRSHLNEWRSAAKANDTGDLSPDQIDLAGDIIGFLPEQQAAVLFDALDRQAFSISIAETIEQVDLLKFPLDRTYAQLIDLLPEIRQRPRKRLQIQLEKVVELIEGPRGLQAIRKAELAAIGQAEDLLAQNNRLSTFLTNRASALIAAANQRIDQANQQAIEVRALSRDVLLGVAALSIVCSLLIVWLYVSRNLTARLTGLSDSMLAIAGGDLRTELPSTKGHDEISQMAQALVGFRDTAIEIEENNLREVATARQRLIDAIESINEGFAFYDSDDRLIMCNRRYTDLLYEQKNLDLSEGTTFEDILRHALKSEAIQEAVEDPETWLQERLERHRNPGQPIIQHRAGDRWVMISERKVTGGGTVAIYSDLTDLKKREAQLSHANHQILSSVHYASRIQEAMLPSR